MLIPDNIALPEKMHGHGLKGSYIYMYRNDEFGVEFEARRQGRSTGEQAAWHLDALPGQTFSSFAELRAAAVALTPEQVAVEASKYPMVKEAKPDNCGNRCRLCPRPSSSGMLVLEKHDTTRVALATSWRNEHFASLCADHWQQYRSDPAGLHQALQEEVRERIKRAQQHALTAARPLP